MKGKVYFICGNKVMSSIYLLKAHLFALGQSGKKLPIVYYCVEMDGKLLSSSAMRPVFVNRQVHFI